MKKKLEEVLLKAKDYLSLDDILINMNAITDEEIKKAKELIEEMVLNYDIDIKEEKYILMRYTSKRKGIFLTGKTYDKVLVGEQEFVVEKDEVHKAINKDEVLIHIPYLDQNKNKNISKRKKKQKKLNHIKIEKIIKRDLQALTGQVYTDGNNYLLSPDDKSKRKLKIFLEGEDFILGEKVFVTLKQDETSLENNLYHANFCEKIGFKSDPEYDILHEAYKLGIYKGFNDETLNELESIPNTVLENDKIGKADLTDWEIFTIDGDDTKDIDDAISLHKDKNGNMVLGVHIAYPAHYIKKDGAIYNEALLKGTSCYPTSSRVFPMLHPKLSNGICSLNPKVERLAVSYIMTFDQNANVIDYKILESVIKSRIQMTYKKVNDLLEKNIVHEGYEEHKNTLLMMKELSDKLFEKRKQKGSLMLETEELKIALDEEGKVSSIKTRKLNSADKIIESFMVASAENYALFCKKNDIPCIFRNHDHPDKIRIEKFLNELSLYGIPYNQDVNCNSNKSVQQLAEHLRTTKDLYSILISRFIRSLRKADFGINNIGHSGLASNGHSPNTSPMRRGNDFIDQYVLKEMYLDNIDSKEVQKQIEENIPEFNHSSIKNLKVSKNVEKYRDEDLNLIRNNWSRTLASLTEHLSEQEKKAANCEREVNQMKIAEKFVEEIGSEHEGIITSFNSNSIFVQIEDLIEGRICLDTLSGYYKYDEKNLYVKSKNDNDNYYFGDKVIVSVKSANKLRKSIQFTLKEKIEENTTCRESVEAKIKIKK